MNNAIRYIGDDDVQRKAEEAADAACKVLDEMFPGFDNGGITSNFIGGLKEVILRMLAGQSVVGNGSTHLPKLVLTDTSFGYPFSRGDAFLVVKCVGHDWVERDGRWGKVSKFGVLSDAGSGFVELSDTERIDPFVSYDAAVMGALNWLRHAGVTQQEERLMILPAVCGEHGYVLNPDSGRQVALTV
jgi:hypothetical protein